MFGRRKMINSITNETKYVIPEEFELYLKKGFTFSKRSHNRKDLPSDEIKITVQV